MDSNTWCNISDEMVSYFYKGRYFLLNICQFLFNMISYRYISRILLIYLLIILVIFVLWTVSLNKDDEKVLSFYLNEDVSELSKIVYSICIFSIFSSIYSLLISIKTYSYNIKDIFERHFFLIKSNNYVFISFIYIGITLHILLW